MSPEQRVVAYIDGFNLYYGLKESGWKRYYWLNLEALAAGLLKPSQKLIKTKYFTARIRGADKAKIKRQTTYLDAVATLKGVEIFYGHYQPKVIECWNCGHTWPDPKEKMTDVNIAVELLTDAYKDAFDTALLVSGDSDLCGVIQRVRDSFSVKRVIVAFPPRRMSVDLKGKAHGYLHVDNAVLSKSLLPPIVVSRDGFPLCRPAEWT